MGVKREFLDELIRRGYDPKYMKADGWGPDGYYLLAHDSKGRKVPEVTYLMSWKDPLDYSWLLNAWNDRFEEVSQNG